MTRPTLLASILLVTIDAAKPLGMPHSLQPFAGRMQALSSDQAGTTLDVHQTEKLSRSGMSSSCKLCCLSVSDCGFCSLACRHAWPTGLAELSETSPTTSTLPDTHVVDVQVIDAMALQRLLQEMQVTADRHFLQYHATHIKVPTQLRSPIHTAACPVCAPIHEKPFIACTGILR